MPKSLLSLIKDFKTNTTSSYRGCELWSLKNVVIFPCNSIELQPGSFLRPRDRIWIHASPTPSHLPLEA
ncbi:hypothetical protein LguiA_025408 [Lonicera macranthoides]